MNSLTDKRGTVFGGYFGRTGTLTKQKLIEYIPALLMTNLSTLLLISVDGLVVGNLVGADALASVNIFYPVTSCIGIISVLVANGVSTVLSTRMGSGDRQRLLYAKSAVKRVIVLAMLIVAIVQVPMALWLIRSYHLPPEMHKLTTQYAIGVLISMPFGLGSTVGVSQLQTVGKMKVLMRLSVLEGISNLLLDLLFVGVMKMGVFGAGLGTAAANVLRFSATEVYLVTKTDIYHCPGTKARWVDYREILTIGLPEGAHSAMMAAQNYFMIWICLSVFGVEGGTIKGVCSFCFSLVNVLISSVRSSMQPLAGILTGAKDRVGMRFLLRQGILLMTAFAGTMMLLVEIFPDWFFRLHGVYLIPEGGLLSVRLYALFFLLAAYNRIFRLNLTIRSDTKYATVLTVVGNALLPVFAFALTHFLPGPYMWLSYLMTELVLFTFNLMRYRFWVIKENEEEDSTAQTLYLTVKPDEAAEASLRIYQWASENDYPARQINRVCVCMEEMVAYAVASQGKDDINIQIMIRFTPDEILFTMLDDGRCIALDEDKQTQSLIVDNYDCMKRIAKNVEYQYILNMNYTVLRI